MDLTKKEDLARLLGVHGLRLDKNLGQHYLVSERALCEIVEAAELESGDTVLEVGPGAGVLTVELAERVGKVVAVELDRRVVPVLKAALGERENLEVRNEDALETELPKGEWKWVSNVPYQITSPLLKRCLVREGRPVCAVLLVQKEVAEKMCAQAGKQNRLGLLVQNFMKCEMVCKVSREEFFPPPKVESAVVKMVRRSKPVVSLAEWSSVERVIKIGFLQRRKKLKKALGAVYPDAEELLKGAGVDPDCRAENVSLEGWRRITEKAA